MWKFSWNQLLAPNQPASTLSMRLNIKLNCSDENCSLCPIRQLGSSLYLDRLLFHQLSVSL